LSLVYLDFTFSPSSTKGGGWPWRAAAYPIEFLKSCDRSNGWASLLQQIVTDMINTGPMSECWSDGKPKCNGHVIGFMGVIGSAVMHSRVLDRPA
jgi:hypothetical protein